MNNFATLYWPKEWKLWEDGKGYTYILPRTGIQTPYPIIQLVMQNGENTVIHSFIYTITRDNF